MNEFQSGESEKTWTLPFAVIYTSPIMETKTFYKGENNYDNKF